jgi:hypothetical protein
MIIESQLMEWGLFGQAFSWLLDLLPYCDRYGGNHVTEWRLRSKHYGEPPDFSLLPMVFEMVYKPEPDPIGRVSFEDLHWHLNPNDGAGRHFKGDFNLANKYWSSYFRLTPVVTDMVDEYCKERNLGANTLALHYRGTDQYSIHNESTPVTIDEFLLVLEDFLFGHTDIKRVFAASDEEPFMVRLDEFCKAHGLEMFMHDHDRAKDGRQTYLSHPPEKNKIFAYEAIRDCYTLSRCHYCLSNFSALSAWSKVLNPELLSYRISSCKIQGTDRGGAFPHGWAPKYLGNRPEVQELLKRLQSEDWQLR